ncbi:MAG TPA: nuclear transport factor 2 family protein [Blastocatellia bacterium]|jgi:ketosteroid isomerase-like protein|nr:nuclear transport factor 2 family protein [Blastocatellia bacterium]
MNRKSVEIIAELYAAMARRDLPAMLELFDPDFSVSQTRLLPWGGEYHGFEGLQKFFAELFRHVESQLTVEEFVDAGEKVIVIGRTRGHVKATGAQFNIRAVHVWTVKGGKGIRFEPNVDTPKMLEALGHCES